jgi:peptidoglycan/xylan/chitin deacetylase (PgdA/CDA1 family)
MSEHDFVILAYHRVIPRNEAKKGVQAGMYVEPNTFERHLRFLKKYFTIVPIYKLPYGSKGTLSGLNAKPLCVLTFDDGWYDFYTYAFPILKAHQVPVTVFLPTDFIGTNAMFWTDRLAHLLGEREHIEKTATKLQFSGKNLVDKIAYLDGPLLSKLEKAITILKQYRINEIEDIVSGLSERWKIELPTEDRYFLTWDEIREIAQSGLISFGSHTAKHLILTNLKVEEIRNELVRSKERLASEDLGDPSFIPLSYPNGGYNHIIAELVREAGYSMALTTDRGWNTDRSNRFALKRVPIHQDMTFSEAMLGCRIVGLF